MLAPAGHGFILGLSFILAIGAQNAFVLRQGLLRQHVLAVCLVCALSDALLIAAGVAGFGVLVERYPGLPQVMTWLGGAFLFVYGLGRLWAALHPEALHPAEGPAPSLRAALATCLAFTWLNPHVYLDTVVLLGGIALAPGARRPAALRPGCRHCLLRLLLQPRLWRAAAGALFERPAACDERHRHARDCTAAGGLPGLRHDRRHHRRLRDRRGPGQARPHRRGRVHRRVDARGHARHHGLGGLQLADRRRASHAHGQREHDRRTLRRLPDRPRPAQHCRQQAGAVRGAGPAGRSARAGHRSALRQPRGPQGQPLRAEDRARAGAGRPHGREWSTLLNAAGVPAGEVLSVPEVLEHPQVVERGLVKRFADAPASSARLPWCARAFALPAATRSRTRRRRAWAPTPTASSSELGYAADEIATLREQKAI